jgi:hypothetical protein
MKISNFAISLVASLVTVGSPALAFSLAPSSSWTAVTRHQQKDGVIFALRMSSEDDSDATVDKETSIVEEFKEKQSFTRNSGDSKKVSVLNFDTLVTI